MTSSLVLAENVVIAYLRIFYCYYYYYFTFLNFVDQEKGIFFFWELVLTFDL